MQLSARTAAVYFETVACGHQATRESLTYLHPAARNSFHRGLNFDVISHIHRVTVRILWESLLQRTGRAYPLGRLALLTFEFGDLLREVVESAYSDERERAQLSRADVARLFLIRLLEGEWTDETQVLAEGDQLGYDLSATHTAAFVSPADLAHPFGGLEDVAVWPVTRQLLRRFPNAPFVLLGYGLVFLATTASIADVGAFVHTALKASSASPTPLIAGIGTPRAGWSGILASTREARRARALGAILNRSALVHRYDELRVFDLFRQGEALEAYVQEVLGDLIALDRANHSHLIGTLVAYVDSGLNRKLAAALLHVHPNTVGYRLNRIQQVMPRPIAAGDSLFRIQLALRLLPLAGRLGGE
jgi:sugar diacid utilization regulator